MSKITKQDLNERLLMIETLLGLHRKLPEQISIDQANNAIFRMQYALSNGIEIAERDPNLKVLDQSVFDDKPENINWAVVTKEGAVLTFQLKPAIVDQLWDWTGEYELHSTIDRYDASNWQNSLIERESKELAGSDLCRAMLARGDKWVLCFVHEFSDDKAVLHEASAAIKGVSHRGFETDSNEWECAVPINNQGKPLAAKEAGL